MPVILILTLVFGMVFNLILVTADDMDAVFAFALVLPAAAAGLAGLLHLFQSRRAIRGANGRER